VSESKTSVESSGTMMPGRFGGSLRRGGGNPKRNGGRPPNWLRQFCDDLLASPKCKTAVRKILEDENHPAFATMWKAVGDRAHGKAEASVAHSGEVSIRVVRAPRMLIVDN
jgi:hypothetical protein